MLETAQLTEYHAIMQWLTFNFYDITAPMINAKIQDMPHAPEQTKVPVETGMYNKVDLVDICDYFTHDLYLNENDEEQLAFEEIDDVNNYENILDENQFVDVDLMNAIFNRLKSFGDQHFFLLNKKANQDLQEFAQKENIDAPEIADIVDETGKYETLHVTMIPSSLLDILYRVGKQTTFDFEQLLILLDELFFEVKYPAQIKISDLKFVKFVHENLLQKVTK